MSVARMRTLIASATLALITVGLVTMAASPALAQDPPPKIPLFAIDLHAAVPMFPSDDPALAASRGMQLGELPGSGFGAHAALTMYPLRWKAITFGVGGEVTVSRARKTPPADQSNAAIVLRSSEERFVAASPQLSFNFGTGNGWSYLSGGVGYANWSVVPQGQAGFPPDEERLKTINYGGGARWFMKSHLAFSFDFRIYAISPSSPVFGFPSGPRTNLKVISAGVSLK